MTQAAVAEARDEKEIVQRQTLDGVDLEALARKIPTPFYAYSANGIRARIASLKTALVGTDALICFAVKANSNLAILQLMAQSGVGADIVSAGELWRSLRAGIPASQIVFSGVGKRDDEIRDALDAGILRFNLESRDELELLQRVAAGRGVIANAAVRINPDVDAQTHAKISTGKSENKFGVSIAEARTWFAASAQFPNVKLDGLHVHIGSQILTLEPYRRAFEQVAAFQNELTDAGNVIESIDVGGGLGVSYREGDRPIPPVAYVETIRHAFRNFGGRFVLEPGRWLIADAGLLLTRVLRIKRGEQRAFLVLDAAMNDLVRPSLYDAWHDIDVVSHADRARTVYDVVGPVCESSDTFGRARELPSCETGELLAIKTVGAYGSSMASTFNSRPLVPEVLLDNGRYSIIRRRQTFEEMITGESPADEWRTA